MTSTVNFGDKTYDTRYGGPFDRGTADSYYHRLDRPHYYVGATSASAKIEKQDMTPEEIDAYNAGYAWNEYNGDKKDYGSF